jgi:hypothetical protein
MNRKTLAIVVLCSLALTGCAPSDPALSQPPQTLTRDQFATLYDDHKLITDVWYIGSDADYHHFIMEHWTVNPDNLQGHMDFQKAYQVPVTEFGVKRPFPLTYNKDQWRLMRPHGDPGAAPQAG